MKITFELIINEKQSKFMKSLGCEIKFINEYDTELSPDDDVSFYEITTDDVEDLIGKLLDNIKNKNYKENI